MALLAFPDIAKALSSIDTSNMSTQDKTAIQALIAATSDPLTTKPSTLTSLAAAQSAANTASTSSSSNMSTILVIVGIVLTLLVIVGLFWLQNKKILT
jgi:cobalamin biosynthesis Mg chelatase CobN